MVRVSNLVVSTIGAWIFLLQTDGGIERDAGLIVTLLIIILQLYLCNRLILPSDIAVR